MDLLDTKYARDYFEASALFDKEDFAACQQMCEYNLDDPTLPPYWQIKNCILYFSATGDWDEGELWRRRAERIYEDVLPRCDPKSETEQKVIRELRKNLDQIKAWQDEDRPDEDENNDAGIDEAKTGEEVDEAVGSVDEAVEKVEPPTPSVAVPDPHAQYRSLAGHPALAMRHKPSRGSLSLSLKARNTEFNASSSGSRGMKKHKSIRDLRNEVGGAEEPEAAGGKKAD